MSIEGNYSQQTLASASYNQQALASTSLIRNTIRKHADYLKKTLPHIHTVLEVGVSSQENKKAVHRIATMSLDNTTDKLRVNISVHKYEELASEFRARFSNSAPITISTKEAEPATKSTKEDEPVTKSTKEDAASTESTTTDILIQTQPNSQKASLASPGYVQAIQEQDVNFFENLAPMDGEPRSASALTSLERIREIFPHGIPLPTGKTILQHHFKILTQRVDKKIEKLSSYSTNHHLFAWDARPEKGIDDSVYLSKVYSEGDYTLYGYLLQEFTRMKNVAQNKALPSSFPAEPKNLESVSYEYKHKAIKANDHKILKEKGSVEEIP